MTAQELTVGAQVPPAEATVGEIMMNVPLLQQIDHMAARMATSKATIPAHLRGNEGDCWAVIMQAIQWKMNPYVVAQKTHLVNGTLGYEAQLVNAVVQNSGMIIGPFRYEYRGEGASLECRVGAKIKGDDDITWNEWLMFSSVTTKNSPLWKTNPKQQMGYLQVKNWTRANCPGAILGIYTPDELELIPEREVGPQVSDINEALKADTAADDVADAEVVEDAPEEPQSSDDGESITYASCASRINQAPEDEFDEIKSYCSDYLNTVDDVASREQQRKELGDLIRIRRAQLKAIADEQG